MQRKNIKQGGIYTDKNVRVSKIPFYMLMSEICQVFLAQYFTILAGFGPIIFDFSSQY